MVFMFSESGGLDANVVYMMYPVLDYPHVASCLHPDYPPATRLLACNLIILPQPGCPSTSRISFLPLPFYP